MPEISLPNGTKLELFESQYTPEQIEASIGKGPIIQNGTFWTWDITTMAYVDTGVPAGGSPGDAAQLFGPVLVTLTAAGWQGNGPWTQQVEVAGVTAADDQLEVIYTTADDAAYAAAYQCINQIESVDGALVFTCFNQKPVTDIEVKVVGVY